MARSNTLTVCQEHLFSDIDKMKDAGVPEIIQARIIRIRDIYNMWLQFPSKKEQELVQVLKTKYGIKKTEAYADLKLIKILLGDLNQSSKDFHRWRFNTMILKAAAIAEHRKDARSLVAALDKYAKYNKLDKDDEYDNPFERIAVQPFEPTENPEVIGIKRVPNIAEKIQKKIKQYWSEDIEDITFEETDFNEDDLFKNE